MTSARVHSAAAGLVLFAAAAITAVSFIAVTGAALRLSGGVLALPVFIAALGLEAAKIGLPVLTFRLLKRRERLAARISAGAWASAFAVCALAAFAFFSAPHKIQAGRSPELARKIAALKVIDRARDNPDLDYETYDIYGRRAVKLRAEIADLRTQPPKTVVVGGGLAGQLLGVIGVVAELISALGLLLYRWAIMRDDERVIPAPEPVAPVNVAPAVATTLLQATPRFVRGSDLQFENLQWLWPGVLPSGAFCLIGGVGGVGKSTACANIAALVTSGGRWPTGEAVERGAVVYCEIEDHLASVTGPALAFAGADMRLVDLCSEPFDLSMDISPVTSRVEALEADTGVKVRLAVLSPVRNFFGNESYRDVDVRAKLDRLCQWAESAGVCLLGVLHPKDGKEAFAGASAWKDKARAGLFVQWKDGKKGGQRIIKPLKANIGRYDWILPFDIEGGTVDGCASKRVMWGNVVKEGDSAPRGSDVAEASEDDEEEAESTGDMKRSTQLEVMLRFLIENGETSGAEIKRRLRDAGFTSNKAVYAAADRIGVIRDEKGEFGGSSTWRLPPKLNGHTPPQAAAE